MHRLYILFGMFIGSYLGWYLGGHWGWWGSFILSGLGSIGGVFAGWKIGQRIDRD
ncbi:hypothetical protein [Cephaloticoccus primus]|uniref:hypothetical protein n=1 Tax=Cephaloticoccus primus TaxID=1548207 RepID=UPI0012E8CF39|nr:hypothetical protein [Cephaloticoccus primus]